MKKHFPEAWFEFMTKICKSLGVHGNNVVVALKKSTCQICKK